MKILIPALSLLPALALAACQNTSGDAEATANAAAAEANLAAPVALPPAEAARVSYRCQPGNTAETVVFYQGDRQVGVMNASSPPVTILKRTEQQGPYTLPRDGTNPASADGVGEGLTVTGDQQQVVITEGGKPTRTCKV